MKTNPSVKRTKQDRDFDLFNRCKEIISGHWFDVRKSRCTFAEYLKRAQAMRERLERQGRAKLPFYRREALHAFDDGFYALNQWEKVWVHAYDGKAFIGWDALPEAGKEIFRASANCGEGLSVHVWPGPEVVNGAPIASLALWGELKA